jgi:hypothetical protein
MKSAVCLATLFFFMCLPGNAFEVETGSITICDTQKQVERFAQLLGEDPEVAIGAVNAEEKDPHACALVDVAYLQGPRLGMARNSLHAFRIVPILVVGTSTPAGYQPVTPTPFFALVEVKEFAV